MVGDCCSGSMAAAPVRDGSAALGSPLMGLVLLVLIPANMRPGPVIFKHGTLPKWHTRFERQARSRHHRPCFSDAGSTEANRSRVTNGTRLLQGIDGRSASARRFRDLVRAYEAEFNIS